MAAVLNVYAQRGATRVGLWCERCALPSRIETDVYLFVLRPEQIPTSGPDVLSVSGCTDCGST